MSPPIEFVNLGEPASVSALLVTSFGAILIWGKDQIIKESNDVIGPLIYKLYGETVARDYTDLASNILRFTSPFGLVFFVLGIVSLAICLFGFCGACCKNRTCLKTVNYNNNDINGEYNRFVG
ncbi:unnamed protein product [Trichobilharzia regenti]|nr:unnamed protein product [Trichobilharzia regenti]